MNMTDRGPKLSDQKSVNSEYYKGENIAWWARATNKRQLNFAFGISNEPWLTQPVQVWTTNARKTTKFDIAPKVIVNTIVIGRQSRARSRAQYLFPSNNFYLYFDWQ